MITALYFGVLVGLLVFNLFTHVQIASRTGWPRREALLLILGSAVLVYDLATYAEYQTTDIDFYFALIRVQAIFGVIFFVSLLEYFETVAGRTIGPAVRAFEATFGIYTILRIVLPFTGIYRSVRGMEPMILPWGDRINLMKGDSSPFSLVYLGFIVGSIAIGVASLSRLRRSGGKREANFLVIAVGFLVAGIFFDFAVAMGFIRGLYLTETSYVAFMVLVSLGVTDEVIRFSELRKVLQHTLDEKDTLIREIHHRVKNNLAVLMALLRLQADEEPDGRFRTKLGVIVNRIHSIAQVHEMAYAEGDFASIDLGAYMDEIARSAISSLDSPDIYVEARSASDSVRIPLDIAIPLGLIANEIVTDSIMHAFEAKAFKLIFHEEHQAGNDAKSCLSLVIGDNGLGNTGTRGPSSLGTELIEALAGQIGAEIERDSGNGTTYRISVPLAASGI